MYDKHDDNSYMIDMSARLDIKVEPASDAEIERKKEEFDHLSNSIESSVKNYKENVIKQVTELLEDSTKKFNFIQSTKSYDKTLIDDKAACLKENSDFHKIYSLHLQDSMMRYKANQVKFLKKLSIIIVLSFAIIVCKLTEKAHAPLTFVRIPNYLLGVACIFSPILLAFTINSIIKQVLVTSGGNKRKIFNVRFVLIIAGAIFFLSNIGSGINFITMAYALGREESESDGEKFSQTNLPIINDNISSVLSNDQENEIPKLDYTEEFIYSVEKTYNYIEDEQSQNFDYIGDDIVATSSADGIKYTLDQLANHKLLVPYKENEKEILFYGQYSKNNNWDDICIFNIYGYDENSKSNVLETILEAEYNDGILLSYKKVIRATTTQDNAVWSIFDGQIVHDNDKKYAQGETWNYFRVSEFPQEFDLKDADVENIIYIDDFEERLRKFSILEGYYCGNISNGFYNDDTGDAFTVKYTESGIIRTLYVGRFKNGLPDDQSGDAWQIVFDGSYNINKYFYYKGPFEQNKRKDNSISLKYLSLSEIDEMTENIKYDFGSGWYDKDSNLETDKVM